MKPNKYFVSINNKSQTTKFGMYIIVFIDKIVLDWDDLVHFKTKEQTAPSYGTFFNEEIF